MNRPDNARQPDQLRPISFQRSFTKYAAGSVLVSFGDTKVICTASIDETVPPFLRDTGQGWITAEYSMLPGATHTRTRREVSKGHPSGRSHEIQRLIGRALRSAVDLSRIGSRTICIDADVIQADGGTRTAAISGSMLALWDATQTLLDKKLIFQNPIKEFLAAVSVGICNGTPILDLCYEEDSKAEVDMNVVMTESGKFVEIQGTAESKPFSPEQNADMLNLASQGIAQIITKMTAI